MHDRTSGSCDCKLRRLCPNLYVDIISIHNIWPIFNSPRSYWWTTSTVLHKTASVHGLVMMSTTHENLTLHFLLDATKSDLFSICCHALLILPLNSHFNQTWYIYIASYQQKLGICIIHCNFWFEQISDITFGLISKKFRANLSVLEVRKFHDGFSSICSWKYKTPNCKRCINYQCKLVLTHVS